MTSHELIDERLLLEKLAKHITKTIDTSPFSGDVELKELRDFIHKLSKSPEKILEFMRG